MKKCLTVALIAALLWCPLWAQSGPDQNSSRNNPGRNEDPQQIAAIQKKVNNALSHSRRVFVATYDHRRLQGFVSEIEQDNFVLTVSGRSTTLAYADVESITWRKHLPRSAVAAIAAVSVAGFCLLAVYLLGGLKG